MAWRQYSARAKLYRFIEFKLEDRRSSRACVAALWEWKDNIEEKCRIEHVMLQILQRRMNASVARALDVWVDHEREQQRQVC